MRQFSLLLIPLVLGCGRATLTGDAGPGDEDASTADGGTTECLPEEELCDDVCTNTETEHDHCGDCNDPCGDSEVCDQGECSETCSNPDHEICEGGCVDLETNHEFCGSCTNPCDPDQACVSGVCEQLSELAVAEIQSIWPVVTGWTDENDTGIVANFTPVALPDARYRCRTGPASMLGGIAFANCMGDGTLPRHSPVPVAGTEEGSYRTEVKIVVGAYQSPVVGHDFYVHHSLDGVDKCPPAGTDAEIFAAADPALNNTAQFPASTQVRAPFIHIPFVNVFKKRGLNETWEFLSDGGNIDVDVETLRRRFALSADRTMLLMQRTYESRMHRDQFGAHTCRNGIRFGVNDNPATAPTRRYEDCVNFVLDSRGFGVCVDLSMVPAVRFSTEIGYVKLSRHDAFSNKGLTEACVSQPFEQCWDWYLYLPE